MQNVLLNATIRATYTLILGVATLSSGWVHSEPPRDLHFREALFYAHQQDYFHALERIDTELLQHYDLDEPSKDSLYPYLGHAEFSVGDFELSYRMHHRAGRAIRAVLEGDVSEPVRNEAAYRLARLHFQKGQMQAALHALHRIDGEIDAKVALDVEFLRANVYLAQARPSEAVDVLKDIQKAEQLHGFSAYNLGVALWRSGDQKGGYRQLQNAGTIKAANTAQQAIKDKSNLVLGTLLMEDGTPQDAVTALQRIRLQGPFANQALLKSGWADAEAGRFDRAVVAWNLLVARNSTQPAVQEAKLALPYAYGQLGVHGRAAVLYGNALNTFGTEISKLDASVASINSGLFLEMVAREEIRHDADWLVRLREQPDTPETFYLTELMASHEFQTALKNYLDLKDLRFKLSTWGRNISAYNDLLGARLAYYDPILPDVDAKFRALDSRIRLRRQQASLIERRMQELLTAPKPEMLATTAEAQMNARLLALAEALQDRTDAEAATLKARIARVRGILIWDIRTQYHDRLTKLHLHLGELKEQLTHLDDSYDAFVRARQASEHSYRGFSEPFNELSSRSRQAAEQVDDLIAKQGELLEEVAIAELKRRRERLDEYQNTARFAMADSYDRATKALQAGAQ